MYNEYFGFKEAPFSIAPDPRYLYMTAQHRDALAHLVYGLNSEGGCILLTGEVGTGKTTICRCLLEQIPEQANVALVLNPKVNEIELLETICDELKINYPEASNSVKTYTDRIYDFLISSNQRNEKTVLIIDEAQNLDSKVLEQLRLLTNLETNQRKLLQIIILGQPELLDILANAEMRQLAQRITARFHLQPLTRDEVKAYISHRLAIAGQNIQLFPENSIKLVYKLSKGIPRLINIICDRALLGAYVENQYRADPSIIKKAANEVFGELKNVEQNKRNKQRLYPLIAVASVLMISLAAFLYYKSNTQNTGVILQNVTANKLDNSKPPMEPGTTTQSTRALPPADIASNAQNPGIQQTALIDTGPEPDTTHELTTGIAEAEASNTIETQPEPLQPEAAPAKFDDKEYDDINTVLASASYNPASAYEDLFNTWGVSYDKYTSRTACNQAENYSLSCLYKHGNLNSLKRHNRPALLTLTDNQGKKRYITIVSINTGHATVYAGNKSYTIKSGELDKYWYGKYILLWRKPKHYTSAIKPGDHGAIINWLTTQLVKVSHAQADIIASTYDKNLVEKVKAFQIQQGLTADGIVGPVTIIHLNTLSGSTAPALVPVPVPSAMKQN